MDDVQDSTYINYQMTVDAAVQAQTKVKSKNRHVHSTYRESQLEEDMDAILANPLSQYHVSQGVADLSPAAITALRDLDNTIEKGDFTETFLNEKLESAVHALNPAFVKGVAYTDSLQEADGADQMASTHSGPRSSVRLPRQSSADFEIEEEHSYESESEAIQDDGQKEYVTDDAELEATSVDDSMSRSFDEARSLGGSTDEARSPGQMGRSDADDEMDIDHRQGGEESDVEEDELEAELFINDDHYSMNLIEEGIESQKKQVDGKDDVVPEKSQTLPGFPHDNESAEDSDSSHSSYLAHVSEVYSEFQAALHPLKALSVNEASMEMFADVYKKWQKLRYDFSCIYKFEGDEASTWNRFCTEFYKEPSR
ncbi:hypothetical protein GLAREA_11202 [Glarea lozoyensis ATCC 20868]|uniref:Uncharacterized protein n=1 Tax=Glarea lozoyensis (strain ATCC 20868 / MF5171) TaxID=1116229 RepID=S3EAZ9_GLAL2|nr:uncharacterized protein GLAREA_11202 [Glarea lozoyensis ATCC 20868]EPE35503.1 hypothetical protein GLAREA_11202 [Glarea lozoyensis ATCC 20868]